MPTNWKGSRPNQPLFKRGDLVIAGGNCGIICSYNEVFRFYLVQLTFSNFKPLNTSGFHEEAIGKGEIKEYDFFYEQAIQKVEV